MTIISEYLMMTLVGYLGGFLFAICAFPELYKTIVNKRCDIGWGMLILWFVGEVLMLFYSFWLADFPLIINYVSNFIIVTILLTFKIKTMNWNPSDGAESAEELLED
jgi:lipid-A-disaccharide synthase-like uncharacterized protein